MNYPESAQDRLGRHPARLRGRRLFPVAGRVQEL
jgi:hypothetical protein